MADKSYLRIPRDEQAPVVWLHPGSEGTPALGRGDLTQAAGALGGHSATVLVSTEQVLLTRVDLPVRSRQRLLQALPFALEEDLVDPVDQLHFAPGPSGGEDGATAVAVVRDEFMQQWCASLDEAGIQATTILPEVLALPRRERGWSLWLEPGVALLRTSATQGLALDADNLELLLPAMLEREAGDPAETGNQSEDGDELPSRVFDLYLCGDIEPGDDLRELLAQHCSDIREHRVDELLELVRTPPADSLPETLHKLPNLRQGAHASHSEQRELWRRWRPVAMLAAIVVVAQFALNVWELQRLDSRAQALQAETGQLFSDTFPDVGRVVDMRVQARREMSRLRQGGEDGDAGFLWLMEQLARAMNGADEVRLASLSYQAGRLELQLTAPELAAIEEIRSEIRNSSVDADIQSVSSQDDGVSVRLTLREQSE